MELDSARQAAYSQAYSLLRAAAGCDPVAFDMAFNAAYEGLMLRFPDDRPTIVDTLMAYSASLGRAARGHPRGQA